MDLRLGYFRIVVEVMSVVCACLVRGGLPTEGGHDTDSDGVVEQALRSFSFAQMLPLALSIMPSP